VVNGPIRDDENDVSAFVQAETESTYRFLWNGIKAALILVGVIVAAGAVTILIWRSTL